MFGNAKHFAVIWTSASKSSSKVSLDLPHNFAECCCSCVCRINGRRRSREFQFREQIYQLKIVGYCVYECACAGNSSVLGCW